ncbi:MAG: SUMF1/EgtB/PvdO family nonheme iron enzyme [Proteobacteria bacterium]|nr:SUMF1/EgtB/PvdO family nonheme iron enzyme [Pseudomonadota bacterium]
MVARLRLQARGGALGGDAEQPASVTLMPATFEDVPTQPSRAAVLDVGAYEDLGMLGRGGMATVRRVRDPQLRRVMAMKILRPELASIPRASSLFRAEAQTSAQLAHPGIVPVHEIGELPDGQVYFTMKEVHGRTFTEVIAEVHDDTVGLSAWTLPRLVSAFRQVCDAVAYAHARSVVHRDLKPDNIMVGDYGEVLVLDWGVAKTLGGGEEPVQTIRAGDAHGTQAGSVTGTPAYMAPEQARGEIDAIGPHSDVYALGGVLYVMLTGNEPRRGGAREVLGWVRQGVPLEPIGAVGRGGLPIPKELARICTKALAVKARDRFADASQLAAALDAWLDGSLKRQEALEQVDEARRLRPQIGILRARAEGLFAQAEAILEPLPAHAPERAKAPGWALQDTARGLLRDAEIAEVELTRRLQAALAKAEVPEAHALLAEHYRHLHEDAERVGDEASAARYERLLDAHDLGPHAAYLSGRGKLSLSTTPPAHVELSQYVTHNRRLVLEPVRSLGLTPLVDVELERGSYLLELSAPGFATARYPVHIGRMQHWDGVPPGRETTEPVALLPAGAVTPGASYVPAGWFGMGGDDFASHAPAAQDVWVDGFVMDRFNVTCAEYLEFLDDLVDQGREAEALRYAPRERAGKHKEGQGAMMVGRAPDGHFVLVEDSDGDVWHPDWPIIQVDWFCARAYAEWRATRDGLPWRLPHEVEWEKAARGVDRRFHPWGDFADSCWTACRENAVVTLPRPVDSLPIDASPYGIRGLAGNCKMWCADAYEHGGPAIVEGRAASDAGTDHSMRPFRGGSWNGPIQHSRSARRDSANPRTRYSYVGIRLVRSV